MADVFASSTGCYRVTSCIVLRGLGFHYLVNRLSLLSRSLLVVYLMFAFLSGIDVLDYFLFWYFAVSVLIASTFVYLFAYRQSLRSLQVLFRSGKAPWRGLRIYPINILMEFENRFDALLLMYLSNPSSVGAYVTGVSFAQTGFYASNALTAILTTNFAGETEVAFDLAVKGQRYAIAGVILINAVAILFATAIVLRCSEKSFTPACQL